MARITEVLQIPIAPERAFDHVADFTTTEQWDPGISSAERLDAGPLQVGARFQVQLKLGPIELPLVYEITTYERPSRVVLTTVGPTHRGEDDVTFAPSHGGTRITWNAAFALRGPGLLIDPALGVGFRRAAKEAVAGLEASLRDLAAG
jgi:carbon monoxide dehydrogenase subunit G